MLNLFIERAKYKEIKHRMAQLKPVESSLIPEKAIMVDQNEEKIFDDYFSSACFVLAQDATKEVILQELLSQMGQGEEQDFVSCMQDLMKQREKMSSVIFSEQIAVPHPIKPIAKHHKIGVAASRLAFFVKLTAFKKGAMPIRSKPAASASTTSSSVPLHNSFVLDKSPAISHDRAFA